ncbi:unnamed protein product, partial [Polarella glacialis]
AKDWKTSGGGWGKQGQGWNEASDQKSQSWGGNGQQSSWESGGSSGSQAAVAQPAPAPAARPAAPSGPSKPWVVVARLEKEGRCPTVIEEWARLQDEIWAGHRPLPQGWTRVWSRSRKEEYYARVADNFSTFDLNVVFGALPG